MAHVIYRKKMQLLQEKGRKKAFQCKKEKDNLKYRLDGERVCVRRGEPWDSVSMVEMKTLFCFCSIYTQRKLNVKDKDIQKECMYMRDGDVVVFVNTSSG